MALDNVSKLGKLLGNLASEQSEIKANISPDEAAGDDQFVMVDTIVYPVTLVVTKYAVPTDGSFVLGHPVLSKLDGTYQFGGDYNTSDPEHGDVLFTINF